MTQIQDPRAREAIMRLADRHDYEVSQRLSRTITAARREVESVFALSPDAPPQPKVTRIEPRCPRCHQLYDACGCGLEASTTPPPTDDKPQVIPWPKDLTTLVGKRITVAELYPGGSRVSATVTRRVSSDTIEVVPDGEMSTWWRTNLRLLSIEDPSPPAETEWLPEGMKPPSLTSADDRNEVTEWTGQKYASAWREVIAARDSHWRAHCERITAERDEVIGMLEAKIVALMKERDESNQRHARVVEECDRLRKELKAKGGGA